MPETTDIIRIDNALLKQSNLTNEIKSHKILNLISDVIQNSDLLPSKDKVKKTLSVSIKPEIAKGIKQGKFIQDKGSLIIRDVKTGKIVSHARLNEVLKKVNDATVLSNIVNLAGQAQLAEISKKLDTIHNKVNAIGEFQWLERESNIHGLKKSIEDAIVSLPNEYAIIRINSAINELNQHADFLYQFINKLLKKDIPFKLTDSLRDSVFVWEWNKTINKEFNSTFNHKIKDFLNEFTYLLDLYTQTLGLIGTCYQITKEEHHAYKYFNKISQDTKIFSHKLTERLIVLLEINQLNHDELNLVDSIINHIDNHRNLPNFILTELKNNKNSIIEASELSNRLYNQFDDLEITYNINYEKGEQYD